jgi:bidirectional [NiFe] hydrogenase diaphorase subunit
MSASSIEARKPGVAVASKPHPSGDNRFKLLEATMKRLQYQPDALIEVLHKAQELFGYLSTDLLISIAHSLKLPPSRVYGVATFYHFFTSSRWPRRASTPVSSASAPPATSKGPRFSWQPSSARPG